MPGRLPCVRPLASACSLAAALGLAGCSHQPVRASQPATAPTSSTSAGTMPARQARLPAERSDDLPPPPAETPRISPAARLLSTEEGLASWYGTVYDHRKGADGTVYDQNALTAASRTLPLGVLARVTNLADGEVTVVRITDRGPFVPGRILDLSRASARAIGLDRAGVGKVRVEAYIAEGFQVPPAKWCVQIGAFVDPADARQLRNDLHQRYPIAKIIAFDGPTGSWVRLTLPAPEDRDKSAEIAATVNVPDPGVEAYVTRTN